MATLALRASSHGNEQIVCGAFLGNQGSKAMGIGYSEEVAPTQRTGTEIDLVQTLKIRSGKEGGGNVIVGAVAIAENIIGRADQNGGNGIGAQEEIAYTQNATGVMGVCTSTVRRLLPIECERLMGFPDDWTKIPFKGKSVDECPDSPRYKACGNSMCVNVMRWIGEQIQKVEEKCNGI